MIELGRDGERMGKGGRREDGEKGEWEETGGDLTWVFIPS